MPSRHGRRSRSSTLPSGVSSSALLGDGRPQDVAAEMLEPLAVARRHGHGGMQIEALEDGRAAGRSR